MFLTPIPFSDLRATRDLSHLPVLHPATLALHTQAHSDGREFVCTAATCVDMVAGRNLTAKGYGTTVEQAEADAVAKLNGAIMAYHG